MTAPVDRVRALLARAADAGATEEEARTSAVIAARLIRQHGIPIGLQPTTLRYVVTPARHREPEPDRAIIRSKYAGYCKQCGDPVREGERVAWARGAGAICLDCHRGRRCA